MNNRALMREKAYCMYHDINWFDFKRKCWVRYDNMRGKPPKKRWTYKVSTRSAIDWPINMSVIGEVIR